jgi:hypothetical protein
MLRMGLPVSAGTDATRVASYNPWVCLSWLVTGRTVGGLGLYPEANRLSREQALRLYTQAGGWFSNEEGVRGTLRVGQLADLAVLSDAYFAVPDERIKGIESVLTVVGGNVVHAAGPFAPFAPPPLPVGPDWSPVGVYGGYQRGASAPAHSFHAGSPSRRHDLLHRLFGTCRGGAQPLWGTGCGCWAY